MTHEGAVETLRQYLAGKGTWVADCDDAIHTLLEERETLKDGAAHDVTALKARIEAALAVGHNDDCLFCGFKDKALKGEEGTDA